MLAQVRGFQRDPTDRTASGPRRFWEGHESHGPPSPAVAPRPPSRRAGGSANAWTAFLPSEQLGDFPISETAKVDGPRKTEVFARDPPVEYHGRNAVTFPYCPGWQVAGMTLPPRIEMLRRLPV